MYKVAYFTVQPVCINVVVGLASPEITVMLSLPPLSKQTIGLYKVHC